MPNPHDDCPVCNGTGAVETATEGSRCPRCRGTGSISVRQPRKRQPKKVKNVDG